MIANPPLLDIDTWPEARVSAWQLDRLRTAVEAASRSPFYARVWGSAGVSVEDLKTLEDLAVFPIVSKQNLLQEQSDQDLVPGNVGFSTRGTSGPPLVLWLDGQESEAYITPTMRGYKWAGFEAGMTALLMSPASHRLAAMEAHAVTRLGGHAAFFWGSMDHRYVDNCIDMVAAIRPEFITTTAPFLFSILRRCEDRAWDANHTFKGVRSIISVGLPLTPRLRSHIAERLGVGDVFERSGTQEGAALDECSRHTAPHVHADVCHLEVIDELGRPVPPGRRGRLVVTKLIPSKTPVIRYETGDIAELLPGECGCGRSLPRLKIYGRPESSVVVAGRTITAYDVRLCLDESPTLVGRLLLLVRHPGSSGTLQLIVEGFASDEERLRERLRMTFGVAEATVEWTGRARLEWGFRQVVGRSAELAGVRREEA